MGNPLSGRIATQFKTSVYDLDQAAVAAHAEKWGSSAIGSADELVERARTADVIVTCLPNTNLTRITLDTLRPSLREGMVWLCALRHTERLTLGPHLHRPPSARDRVSVAATPPLDAARTPLPSLTS
jgi:hypothetical protein